MQDPEFEKIVRKKMEEFDVSPSDSLWEKVELELNKKKSKRPLIWLLLLLGLIVSGGAYLILSSRIEDKKSLSGPLKAQTQVADEPITKRNGKMENPADRLRSFENKKRQLVESLPLKIPVSKNAHKRIGQKNQETYLGSSIGWQQKNDQSNRDRTINKMTPEQKGVADNQGESITESGDHWAKKRLPSIVPFDHSILSNYPNLPITPSTSKNPTKEKKKSSWKMGINLTPGISGIEKQLFRSSATTDLSTNNPASLYAAAGGYYTPPSTIQPGFSFAGGVFVQKGLKGRLSFTLGINYHYFSTRIRTGYKIDSFPSSVLGPSTNLTIPGAYALSPVYLTGSNSTYINQYHFVELPVHLQWQLNRSQRLPVSLEAGIALSELVASNGLHFDEGTGTYFKDNALFNKTQIIASASLLIGFWQFGHLFQVGPELQYGASNLIQDNPSENQHLLFYGLKLTLLTGK
jgi:hypothetical protein